MNINDYLGGKTAATDEGPSRESQIAHLQTLDAKERGIKELDQLAAKWGCPAVDLEDKAMQHYVEQHGSQWGQLSPMLSDEERAIRARYFTERCGKFLQGNKLPYDKTKRGGAFD